VNAADGPIVALLLRSRPQTLTLVRGMLSGLAELLEMDPELLDDLKTAVSEACNNVVLHAYGSEPGPMEIQVHCAPDALRVTVRDEGVGPAELGTDGEAAHGIGVSVIQALTREARFVPREGGGTEVTMVFDAERDGIPLFTVPGQAGEEVPLGSVPDGELELSLSPVSLLSGVLGRLARTLAAGAHFSLDRFSDVYLVTDTLAAHAARAAATDRVLARMSAAERRLRIAIGPFRPGAAASLVGPVGEGPAAARERLGSPLALLADEIEIRETEGGELVDVVVVDHRD
jgi:anti-sigma regulatory factor (Ser/Thr protein kinase)